MRSISIPSLSHQTESRLRPNRHWGWRRVLHCRCGSRQAELLEDQLEHVQGRTPPSLWRALRIRADIAGGVGDGDDRVKVTHVFADAQGGELPLTVPHLIEACDQTVYDQAGMIHLLTRRYDVPVSRGL